MIPENLCFNFNTEVIHPSWHAILAKALSKVNLQYLEDLANNSNWLPGSQKIFNAFQIPLEKTRFILLGESPYPRTESANGFAFWDACVQSLWSAKGLSKAVNRATSLRNFIKMLLLADGRLAVNDLSQQAISQLDKTDLLADLPSLFKRLIERGYLLLNASLVLSEKKVIYDAKAWLPFLEILLEELTRNTPPIKLLLFGKIAETVLAFPIASKFNRLVAPHPYNLSFINNPEIIDFFKSQTLLCIN